MNKDLDALTRRLAGQPAPLRLQRMEADVARSIAAFAAPVPVRSWRLAATAAALALGLGVGTSAAALREQPAAADDLEAGMRLAPSSLLDTSP